MTHGPHLPCLSPSPVSHRNTFPSGAPSFPLRLCGSLHPYLCNGHPPGLGHFRGQKVRANFAQKGKSLKWAWNKRQVGKHIWNLHDLEVKPSDFSPTWSMKSLLASLDEMGVGASMGWGYLGTWLSRCKMVPMEGADSSIQMHNLSFLIFIQVGRNLSLGLSAFMRGICHAPVIK